MQAPDTQVSYWAQCTVWLVLEVHHGQLWNEQTSYSEVDNVDSLIVGYIDQINDAGKITAASMESSVLCNYVTMATSNGHCSFTIYDNMSNTFRLGFTTDHTSVSLWIWIRPLYSVEIKITCSTSYRTNTVARKTKTIK